MRFSDRWLGIVRNGLVCVLLAGLLTACRHVEPPAPAKPFVLGIGAWNMEWLGNSKVRKDQPAPEAIAQYVRSSGVSVIALEEICATEEGTLRNSILDETVRLLGAEWHYTMFDSKASRGQNCGVMWNSSALKLTEANPLAIAVDRNRSSQGIAKWDRAPYAVQFSAGRGQTDFVLIPVHMKSNSRSNGDTVVHRGEEAQALVTALASVQQHFQGRRGPERDIVLLGDFNTLHHSEPAIVAYEAAGLIDLNPKDLPTQKSEGYKPAPFDRLLVPGTQKEFLVSGFGVVTNGYSESLSDHQMVVTGITILPDDD